MNEVIEIGNIVKTGNWDSPQRGRIYSPEGVCPCLSTMAGGGLNRRFCYMKATMILTRERSEEEKARRHKYGDKGAKFSGGKVPRLVAPDVIGTVTTMVTKDLLLFEAYEEG